jgi:peptidyl-prolyl cis-trans isomerase B (cyclophilin B)
MFKHILNSTLTFLFLLAIAAACSPASTPNAPAPKAAATTQSSGTSAQTTGGSAAALPPQQRNDMYKSAPPMVIDVSKNYRATIETNKGNIMMDLYPNDAPLHVNNLVFLARQGFYDGLTFHRYEPGFVIQGGDPLGNGTGGPGYSIPPEIKRTHPKGALAMARRDGPPETTPSSGSQFYITLDATPNLDGGYTSFGQVTPESMNVVEQIRAGDVINKITIEEK